MSSSTLFLDNYIEERSDQINLLNILDELESSFWEFFTLVGYKKTQYKSDINFKDADLKKLLLSIERIIEKYFNSSEKLIDITNSGYLDITKLVRKFIDTEFVELYNKENNLPVRTDIALGITNPEKFKNYKLLGFGNPSKKYPEYKDLYDKLKKHPSILSNIKDYFELKNKIEKVYLYFLYDKYNFLYHPKKFRFQKFIGVSKYSEFYNLFEKLKQKKIINDFKVVYKFEEDELIDKVLRFKLFFERKELLIYENIYLDVKTCDNLDTVYKKAFYTLETNEVSEKIIEFVDKVYFFLKELIKEKTIDELIKLFCEKEDYENLTDTSGFFLNHINFNFDTKSFNEGIFYINKEIKTETEKLGFMKKFIFSKKIKDKIIKLVKNSDKYKRLWYEIRYYLTQDIKHIENYYLRHDKIPYSKKLYKIVVATDAMLAKQNRNISFEKYGFYSNGEKGLFGIKKFLAENNKFWIIYDMYLKKELDKENKKNLSFKEILYFYKIKLGFTKYYDEYFKHTGFSSYIKSKLLEYTYFDLSNTEFVSYDDLLNFYNFCNIFDIDFFEAISNFKKEFFILNASRLEKDENVNLDLFSLKLAKDFVKEFIEGNDISFFAIKNFLIFLEYNDERKLKKIKEYLAFKLKNLVLKYKTKEIEKTIALIQFLNLDVFVILNKFNLLTDKYFQSLPDFIKKEIQKKQEQDYKNKLEYLDIKLRKIGLNSNFLQNKSLNYLKDLKYVIDHIDVDKINKYLRENRLDYEKAFKTQNKIHEVIEIYLREWITNIINKNNFDKKQEVEKINQLIDQKIIPEIEKVLSSN